MNPSSQRFFGSKVRDGSNPKSIEEIRDIPSLACIDDVDDSSCSSCQNSNPIQTEVEHNEHWRKRNCITPTDSLDGRHCYHHETVGDNIRHQNNMATTAVNQCHIVAESCDWFLVENPWSADDDDDNMNIIDENDDGIEDNDSILEDDGVVKHQRTTGIRRPNTLYRLVNATNLFHTVQK